MKLYPLSAQSEEYLPYAVGGLLYMPAFQENIAAKILGGQIPALMSVAFCLEDAIADDAVLSAEKALLNTLEELQNGAIKTKDSFARILSGDGQKAASAKNVIGRAAGGFDLPLLFVRVRSPEQIYRLSENRVVQDLITGFIAPKFDLTNAGAYIEAIHAVKSRLMPILESAGAANVSRRVAVLTELKRILDDNHRIVVNVRVGGNDFCGLYGLRRNVGQTIYEIGILRDIMTEILSVFSVDYVVSAPVWNYFGNDGRAAWAQGLKKELALDMLNGFIGKTAIHPTQLPIIADALKVSAEDYDDANCILNWQDSRQAVAKSVGKNRLNELKCHARWAKRIKILGDIYGIKEPLKDVLS